MKRLALAGTVVVSVLVATLVGQAQKRTHRKPSKSSPAAKSTIETEALKEARKLADQFVTRCNDDSYRGYLDGRVVAWKGYHLTTEPQTVTPADRYNGIEASWVVRIVFDARWLAGRWIDASVAYCLMLTKREGVWKADACTVLFREMYGGVPPPSKPTCADVLR